MREKFVVFTEEGTRLFKNGTSKHWKVNIPRGRPCLLNIFSSALQNICIITNTIAFIGNENIAVYLSLDFMCSSKLAVFGKRKLVPAWKRSYPRTNNSAHFRSKWPINTTIKIFSTVIGGCTTLFFYNNFEGLRPFNCNRTVTTVNHIE